MIAHRSTSIQLDFPWGILRVRRAGVREGRMAVKRDAFKNPPRGTSVRVENPPCSAEDTIQSLVGELKSHRPWSN